MTMTTEICSTVTASFATEAFTKSDYDGLLIAGLNRVARAWEALTTKIVVDTKDLQLWQGFVGFGVKLDQNSVLKQRQADEQ
ncbi:hypothetical protein C0995_011733 [Termitomyces sp. Mi166|nr:hypothetical protein C0995_011733 [Termitomyces sp. Mi166\